MNSANLISFNYDNKRWEWDLQKISAMNVPEDVVEFLLEELQKRNLFQGIQSKYSTTRNARRITNSGVSGRHKLQSLPSITRNDSLPLRSRLSSRPRGRYRLNLLRQIL